MTDYAKPSTPADALDIFRAATNERIKAVQDEIRHLQAVVAALQTVSSDLDNEAATWRKWQPDAARKKP